MKERKARVIVGIHLNPKLPKPWREHGRYRRGRNAVSEVRGTEGGYVAMMDYLVNTLRKRSNPGAMKCKRREPGED
jgi:hypothetical protein